MVAGLGVGSSGGNQGPIPDPSVVTTDTTTVWDLLSDPVTVTDFETSDDYATMLWGSVRGTLAADQPVDPRLYEFYDALRYFRDHLAADDDWDEHRLQRQFTETLDLASHRLDAWWTSLATRRLFELRERQETDLYDGFDYRFVGDHFAHGEDAIPAAEGAAARRPETADDGSDGASGDTSVISSGVSSVETTPAANEETLQEFDLGAVESPQSQASTGDAGAPVTYVGGYGYVENLASDRLIASGAVAGLDAASGGESAEYIHTPSPQHATTAAILRSGHKHHQDEALGELLAVDLSPGRTRAARQVLDGIRQGQSLGELLGYRFERRLLERTQRYHDENGSDPSFNLVEYKFDFRRAYPAVEGQLDHDANTTGGDGEDGGNEAGAKSDVLDGYRLWKDFSDSDGLTAFLRSVPAEDGKTVDAAASQAERSELGALFDELAGLVDAVTDLLIAETVHQLGKGNVQRAGGTIDDLVQGKQVAEPEVTETPRDHVGVTHRQVVVFDDPATASAPPAWTPETPVIEPAQYPSVSPDYPALASAAQGTSPVLQVRPDAEPNLNAWVGDLLPDPDTISCTAAYRWTGTQDFAAGTVELPAESTTVSVSDLDFTPDLVQFTVAHAVDGDGKADAAPSGWTHGLAAATGDGGVDQYATSVVTDATGNRCGGIASSDGALDVVLDPSSDGPDVETTVSLSDDGFAVSVDSVTLPSGTAAGQVVQYRAYSFGGPATVDVGQFTTASSTGRDSVSLSLDDAEQVVLTAATVPTAADTARETGDVAGVSHGVAVDGDSTGPVQHAVASSTSSDGQFAGVHDDRALHLRYGTGGTTTSASITGLGGSIDLEYSSVDDGTASSPERVVTYAAIEPPDAGSTPAVGVIDPASDREAGDTHTETIGFRPGAIEVIACPSVAAVGTDERVSTTGWSHGVSIGRVTQRTLEASLRPSANARTGHSGSEVLSLSAVADDGTVEGTDRARVSTISDTGFTLSFPDVASGDQVICYRAWPAEPESVSHSVETGLTLADLDLSPLDAMYLSQETEQAGASQLEQRIRYYLFRHRPTDGPPIPDRARLDIQFTEPAPGAPAPPTGLPVADCLEVVRAIRETVLDSRSLGATDLAHPAETETETTTANAAELRRRADTVQDALAAAGTGIDNRLQVLSPDSATAVTDQVQTVRERLSAFAESTPLDAVAAAAGRIDDTTSATTDRLFSELESLAPHLPAGPTEQPDADVTVANRAAQPIAGEAGTANAQVTVSVWSTSAVSWFEHQSQVTTDGDGRYLIDVDCAGVRPGTGFTVVVTEGGSIRDVQTGRVVPAAGDITVERARNQEVSGVATVDGATQVTVTVTEAGASSPMASQSVTTADDGEFSVAVDFASLDPWQAFTVEATDSSGETVFTSIGMVSADPTGVVEDATVLPRLLYLDQWATSFDPYAADSPAGRLQDAVGTTDWAAVQSELGLMRDLRQKGVPDAAISRSDVDAVASLVVESAGDSTPALSELDLTAIDAALVRVRALVRAVNLDRMFDVTGRPDHADEPTVWLADDVRDETVQDEFATTIAFPDPFPSTEFDQGFAPAFETSLESSDVFPRDEDARRFAAYLDALLGALPTLLDCFEGALTDPVGFGRRLRQLVVHPTQLSSGTAVQQLSTELGTLVSTPAGQLSPLEQCLSSTGVTKPFYNRDAQLLSDGTEGSDTGSDGSGTGSDGSDATAAEISGPEATPSGTALTDFRFLLDRFQSQLLSTYVSNVRDGTVPGDRATARSAAVGEANSRFRTLATTVATQQAHLSAGRNAGPFATSLRRGALEPLRRSLLRASYFGVYGSTPQSTIGGTPADETDLVEQAETVLDTVAERHAEAAALEPAPGDQPTVDGQRERLQTLLDDSFQVLPAFEPTNAAALSATFGRSDALQGGDPLAAETWLQRIARVRDRPATFRRALSYAESVTGHRHRDLSVGQLPHRPDELWVGLDSESVTAGRLSLVAQFANGFDGSFTDGPVAGLFVDGFVENVPASTQRTGIALNFDDPNSTAPQSLLVATPPSDGWSRRDLVSVVRDTIDLAQFRLVDLEDLTDFGALLPALWFPNNEAPKPDAPSVDIDRLSRLADLAPSQWQRRFPGGLLGYTQPSLEQVRDPTAFDQFQPGGDGND